MSTQPVIYLLDAFHTIFRAYYAIRSLSTSTGIPTNATYGFLRMLLKLLKERHPSYVGVFFDSPEPNFRHALFPDYKANRDEAPEDLPPQIDWIKRLVAALHLPCIQKSGFEADDLIGTAACHFTALGHPVILMSGDKDLMQLVGDRVRIWDTMKDREFGREGVVERFGVEPAQVVDLLALSGDSSDNVPGIQGIGEKTASELIQKYQSLDTLYAHLEQIPGKRGERLREQKDMAFLSQRLVRIDCKVPWDFTLADFAVREPDWEALGEILRQLEFNRVLADVQGLHNTSSSPPSPVVVPREAGKYRAIQTFETLAEVDTALRKVDLFSFDTETTGLDPLQADLVGISLAWKEGEAVYIPLGHASGEQLPKSTVLASLRPFFEDPRWRKIGQNVKYDLHVLRREGLSVRGVYADTMIASYLLNSEEPHNLDDLAQKYLQHDTIHFEELVGKGKAAHFGEVAIAAATDYSGEDADIALSLWEKMAPLLTEQGFADLFHRVEMPVCAILEDMEANGVLLDTERLSALSKRFETRLAELEKQIYAEAGESFNIQSPKQLAVILFDKLKLPIVARTKTGPSTAVEVLEALATTHGAKIAEYLMSYRQLIKLQTTYVDRLPELIHPRTGRIHSSFNQCVAATGRLSSSDPNLQNIPIRGEEGAAIREAFIAATGWVLLSLDYSQIELRILAEFSKDPHLIDIFKRNEDAHRATAGRLFGIPLGEVDDRQRRIGKTVNFATIYGQGAYRLSAQLKISQSEAKAYIEKYFKEYARVRIYREEILTFGRTHGYVVTPLGRRRYFPDLTSRNKNAQVAAERGAFNAVLQGAAADIMKLAMIQTAHEARRERDCKLILQVHDELVFEVQAGIAEQVAKRLKSVMESVVPHFSVPLTVDYGIGPNWGTAHG